MHNELDVSLSCLYIIMHNFLLHFSHKPSQLAVDDQEPITEIIAQYASEGLTCLQPVRIKCRAVDDQSNTMNWFTTNQVSPQCHLYSCLNTTQCTNFALIIHHVPKSLHLVNSCDPKQPACLPEANIICFSLWSVTQQWE